MQETRVSATEGVTLSGAHGRGLQADGTLEKLIQLSAEGAKRVSLISQAKGQSLVFPYKAGNI